MHVDGRVMIDIHVEGLLYCVRAMLDINLIFTVVWLYRLPIPVGRRGRLTCSNDFYLPSLRLGGGGWGVSIIYDVNAY
jgi:hypothetical protein